jgi:hypothetical protein
MPAAVVGTASHVLLHERLLLRGRGWLRYSERHSQGNTRQGYVRGIDLVQTTKEKQACLFRWKWGPLGGGVALGATVVALLIMVQAASPPPAIAEQPGTITTTVPADTFVPPLAPVVESSAPPLPEWVVELKSAGEDAAETGLITKYATTAETSETTGDSTVYNGEWITYKLVIANDSNTGQQEHRLPWLPAGHKAGGVS